MNTCIGLPIFGQTCLGGLVLRFGDTYIDLGHPGVLAIVLILAAIGIFVFRNPA